MPDALAASLSPTDPAELVPRWHTEVDTAEPAVFGHAGAQWGQRDWLLVHGGLAAVNDNDTAPADATVFAIDWEASEPGVRALLTVHDATHAAPPLAHHEMVYVRGMALLVGGVMQNGSVSGADSELICRALQWTLRRRR